MTYDELRERVNVALWDADVDESADAAIRAVIESLAQEAEGV